MMKFIFFFLCKTPFAKRERPSLAGLIIGMGFFLFPFNQASLQAQGVSISPTIITIDSSAMLEVQSPNKGLLIPRVNLTGTDDANTIHNPATSLLVYNIATAGTTPFDVTPGFYYNGGTPLTPVWIRLITSGDASNVVSWSTLGNGQTIDGTNFIGTTDTIALNFRVKNEKSGRIDFHGPTFLGYQSGNANTDNSNTGFGYQSLFSNTSGFDNTSTGYQALYANTGNYNTAVGYQSLFFNTSGIENTAIGNSALKSNTTGTLNSATGSNALVSNTTGYWNTAVGQGSLFSNTSGYRNTAVGVGAMMGNTTGYENTGIGLHTLSMNTSGDWNTAIGAFSLGTNSTGEQNTGAGFHSLLYNTTGNQNSAFGYGALASNTSGEFNTACGHSSLYTNTTGYYNTAIGHSALFDNSSGSFNTAIGYMSLYFATGSENTAVGDSSLLGITSGSDNTSIGARAGRNNYNGSRNVFIGYEAGYLESGSDKLYIANSALNPPLIYGDFSSAKVGIADNSPLSTLSVNGSFAGKYRSGSSVNMTSSDFFINLTGNGASTLPAANSVEAGTIIIVRNTTGAAINLNAAGTDTLCNLGSACGSTTVSVAANNVVHYTSDGSSQWIQW